MGTRYLAERDRVQAAAGQQGDNVGLNDSHILRKHGRDDCPEGLTLPDDIARSGPRNQAHKPVRRRGRVYILMDILHVAAKTAKTSQDPNIIVYTHNDNNSSGYHSRP